MLAALVALAACGTPPRPFQPADKDAVISAPGGAANGGGAGAPRPPQAAIDQRNPVTVIVQGVYNAPEGVGEKLAAALTVALLDQGVAAGVIPQPTSYTLAGAATVEKRPDDVEVRITWYLQDPKGFRVANIQQIARGREEDWNAGNDRIVSRIALQGAPQLASMINQQIGPSTAAGRPPATPATAAPPPGRGPRVQMVGVESAPGDGNVSLATAMRRSLAGRGFTLVEKADERTLVLKAKVEVIAAGANRERITIVWSVLDLKGGILGDITQSNVIPAGMLKGAWDGIARDIAIAATEGVVELLDQAAKRRQ